MQDKPARTDLKPSYTNGRTVLKLVADFSKHWGFRARTYGYQSARIKVPYKQGADFWVHLSFIAQPRTSSPLAAEPPDIFLDEHDEPFHFQIHAQKLTVLIPLNRRELWGKVQGKSTPLLYVDRSTNTRPLCIWQEKIWLDLRVWVTSEADQPPVPVNYESGDGHTLPGGQFESDRRRH